MCLCVSGFAGAQSTYATPRSHKLKQFAKRLYEPQGQQVLTVIGDSINATCNAMAMQVGYRDQFEMPFNGWVIHADNGNSEIGYTNTQGVRLLDVVRDPGDTFSSGVRGISPVRGRDTIWALDRPPGFNLSDSYIMNSNLVNMKLGNPFTSASGVDGRLIMYEGLTQVAQFEAAGMRALSTISSGIYQRGLPPAGAIVWLDRYASTGPDNPGIRLRSDATTNESLPGFNTLILLGSRIRNRNPDGVQMQFIAHGGWTTVDHVDRGKFTDAALGQYYAATDPPTHVILWLGQNQTLEESNNFAISSYQLYKSNIAAVIDRHEQAIAMLGKPAPKWLLVSQYATGYSDEYNQLMCMGLYSLSNDRANVSYLDLYQLAGGRSFDTAAMLSDGVHPNLAGVTLLAEIMNWEMKSSLCISDFNQDAFVDLTDYNAFIHQFEAGDISADADESGFVDFNDFDFFVQRFEAGC